MVKSKMEILTATQLGRDPEEDGRRGEAFVLLGNSNFTRLQCIQTASCAMESTIVDRSSGQLSRQVFWSSCTFDTSR